MDKDMKSTKMEIGMKVNLIEAKHMAKVPTIG